MEKYHDMFRFVVELSDSKAISTAYFVLVAACVTAHTHRLRISSENRAKEKDANHSPQKPSISDLKDSNCGLPVSVIKIYYLDGCHLSLDVTNETTIKDICNRLSLEMKLGLYEVDQEIGPLTEQMLLPSSMTVEELINRWKLFRWPDAKLVAPVYLKNWAYKQNSRALRHVRFENSYLTRSIEYSPYSPASETSNGGQMTVYRRGRNGHSPNSSKSNSPLENSSSGTSPGVSASTRARERTHALLNSLFTQHTDADPRQFSASVTEMSWENSLRRGRDHNRDSRDHARRSTYSPISPASNANSAPRTPVSMPVSAAATPDRTADRPSERAAERSAERSAAVPHSTTSTPPVATVATIVATVPSPPQAQRAVVVSAQSPETAAELTDASSPPVSTGTRENTPDKIRPRTTVVHLHSDVHRSRTPSPNTTSPVPVAAQLSVERNSPASPAVVDIFPTQTPREFLLVDRDSPVTTNSSVSSYSLNGASSHAHSPGTGGSSNRVIVSATGATRYGVSAEDLAIHTAHARTNALLNKLFGSVPVENRDQRQATPEQRDNSAAAAGISVTAKTSDARDDNEGTQQDEATPAAYRTLHSPHSSGTLTLSRSTSPGGASVTSAAGSVSPGGTVQRRRRTPRSPAVRPPFDTSYSSSFTAPSVSMLLALGEGGAPSAAPRIVLDKRLSPKREDSFDSKARPFPHTVKSRAGEDNEGGEFSTPMKHASVAEASTGATPSSAAASDVKVRLFTRRGSTGSMRVAASSEASVSSERVGSAAAARNGRRSSVAQAATPASTARITVTPGRSQNLVQSPKPLRAGRLVSPSPVYANTMRGRSGSPHSAASSSNNLHMDVRHHPVHDVAFGRGTSAEPRRPAGDDTSVRSASRGRSTSPHSTLSGNSGSHSRHGSARRGSNRSTTNWIP